MFPEKLYISLHELPAGLIFMVERFSFLHDEDDIIGESLEKWSGEVIRSPPEIVPIYTSWCLFTSEHYCYSGISERIREHIGYHAIRKKRFSSRENLFYFFFRESVFFSDHFLFCHCRTCDGIQIPACAGMTGLPTKSFSHTRECHDTSISTGDIVVLTLSTNVLETVRIAYSEDMTTLSATRTKNFLSIYCRFTSEESVNTETFSFLEFTEHNQIILGK